MPTTWWSATPPRSIRPQGDPANPAHLRAMLPTAEAAQTPAEQSLQKLGLAPQQPAMGLQPEQQVREQEQQQNPAHRLG